MPKYMVVAEVTQYFEIEAESPEDARTKAFSYWHSGDLNIDETPTFLCEEADLIEENKNA